MGGDDAPRAPVEGAIRAARESGIRILLVGDEKATQGELARFGKVPSEITVVHAGETIGMDESPAAALLRKRDSSIMVATNLVKEGSACAVVSAGNSGAVTGAAIVRLGMVPNVERPAIATVFPAKGLAGVVVLDVGATVDCAPSNLIDFAYLGVTYARSLLSVAEPRVALLSIGEEPSKGNAVVKKAHALLARSRLNFVGNIEGRDIALGNADVTVLDGFTGNILLKFAEGLGSLVSEFLREAVGHDPLAAIGGLAMSRSFGRMRQRMDYRAYGGAMLLGVRGVVVIGHGRSDADGVMAAVKAAARGVENGLVGAIAAGVGSPAHMPEVDA